MYVAGELYMKCVPGLNGTGCARMFFVHVWLAVLEPGLFLHIGASDWCPVDMHKRSRIRIARRLAEGSAGASSGKNFSTSSSTLSFPSAIASPTAVEVKLLLSE